MGVRSLVVATLIIIHHLQRLQSLEIPSEEAVDQKE